MTSLRMRVFASIGVVSFLGLIIAAVMTRALAPESFAQRLGQGFGRRAEPSTTALEDAFTDAVQQGLIAGGIVALAAALLVAALIARYLTRSISDIRDATRRLAGGDYAIRVPVQHVTELVELGRDINTLAEELDETERRRTRLIGNVAHELRTPLTTIEGYMEGLTDGIFAPTPQLYATVGSEAARLRRLTNDLVALSRAEDAPEPESSESIDLARLIGQVVDRLRPQFSDQGVELTTDLEGAGRLLGSPDQLVQVFTNLLGNALGHTPTGGTVALRASSNKGLTRVTIKDDGDGIPPEDLVRIFERFYRVTPSGPGRTAARPGTGIGLTIARSIARAHGGDITASSSGPGTGAEFTVTLPSGGP